MVDYPLNLYNCQYFMVCVNVTDADFALLLYSKP